MTESHDSHGFLEEPAVSPDVESYYAADVADRGYVMNLSRVWAHSPAAHDALFALLGDVSSLAGLTFRQRGVLVAATASTIGDSYCALAWGGRLAAEAGEDVAGAVLRGDDSDLDPVDAALATWARLVATDPNATTAADLEPLRRAGFDDRQIFGLTVFAALRRAFSTVNDALGPLPDHQLRADAPPSVDAAVTYGRPTAASPS